MDIMAYLKAVKKEYCAFLQVPTKFSVAHCPVQGECALKESVRVCAAGVLQKNLPYII